MCRVLYIQNPRKIINEVGKEKMKWYLSLLENSAGGHGNGLGGLIFSKKRKFLIKKGLEYSHERAIEDMLNYKWINGVMWHTRLASSSTISSINNHPHHDLDNLLIAVHNGHISYASDYLKLLKLMDPRYEKYTYNYYNHYRYYNEYYYSNIINNTNNKNDVTDTWIAVNLLSLMIKTAIWQGKSVDEAILRFWKNVLNNDAFIIQLSNSTVYLLVKRSDFEWTNTENGVIATSEGLHYLGITRYYVGKGVVKILPNSEPEILTGEFKEIEKSENKFRDAEIKEETTPLLLEKIEKEKKKLLKTCYEKCLEKLGDLQDCKNICRSIVPNSDDDDEVEDLLEEYITDMIADEEEKYSYYYE